jgi:uncharacterized membrane protein YdjX (TVP38/TMEM64 family)
MAEKSKKRGTIVRLILVVAVVVLLYVLVRVFNVQELLRSLLVWIDGTGLWAPLIFIGLYIVATVLFIPGSILTLGAGFVFGVLPGTVYVSIGSIIGASAAFLLGRTVARNWIRSRVEANPRFKAIDDAVGREGWKIVGLTRLSPIFPFNLLNYAYGLTKVSFKGYFFASWVGMLPGTIMYVYIGSLAANLATLGGARTRTTLEWVLYGVGLVATVVVTVFVTRLARKALRRRVEDGGDGDPATGGADVAGAHVAGAGAPGAGGGGTDVAPKGQANG